MNNPHPVLKGTAIAVFVVLISGFVAYKSGVFKTLDPGYDKGAAEYDSINFIDSPPPRTTTISSSKSIVITSDSLQPKKKTVKIDSFYMDEKFSSSKSAFITAELEWDWSYLDSLFNDSAKTKKDSVKPKK